MRTSDYGIDAPGTIRTFALVGAGLTAGARLVATLRGGAPAARLAGAAVAAAGMTSIACAGSLAAYGVRGKLAFRDRLIGMIDWRGDEHVLDVGTGRGLLAIAAAKRLTTGTAIGIDIWRTAELSGNGADGARRNAEREGVGAKVEIRTGDARRLAFADAAFDVVLAMRSIHAVAGATDRRTACAEIARVLKPGGTALIADIAGTAHIVRLLGDAGLIVERSRPYLRESLTYLRIVAATKPLGSGP